MRLSKVEIENFKCLEDISIKIPRVDPKIQSSADFLSVIGKNNVGKSSLLEAIRTALPDGDIGNPSADYFRKCKGSETLPIIITLTFDITILEAKDMIGAMKEGSEDSDEVIFILKQTWENIGKSATKVEISIPKLDHNKEAKTLSKKIKEHLPQSVFLPAVKDLADEVGGNKTAVFNKIVDKIITFKLEKSKDEDELQEAYNNLKDAEKSFRELLVDENKSTFKKDTEASLNDRLQQIINVGVVVDYKAPESVNEFNLVSKVGIKISDGGIDTHPSHQGHGAQRTLLLSLYEALANTQANQEGSINPEELIILVEEPEMYMHPQMARKMRDMLVNLSKTKNIQVICTTHSPVFLDLADRHEGIAILQKTGNSINVVQKSGNPFEDDERDRLRMLLNFDAAVNEVFFSNRVCLVEGDTELAAIESYAEKLIKADKICEKKYWQIRRSITAINCRGKWTICAFQKVLNWFEIEYIVVHDKDKEADDEGANKRIADLAEQNLREILIHDKNFEEQIFGKPFSNDKPWRTTKSIREDNIHDVKALEKFFCFILGIDSIDELQKDNKV